MTMNPRRRGSRALASAVLATALLVTSGCGGGASSVPVAAGMPIGSLAPDFSLPDVNPSSATFATEVAPSQYVGSASAWYFGHAT